MTTHSLAHLIEPINDFLADPNVTEVVINRPGEVGVESRDGWSWHECDRMTFDHLDAIGILAASDNSQDISPTTPLCGASLPGGQRIHICRPAATLPDTISLTIRRPPSFRPTISHLAKGGLFTVKPKEVDGYVRVVSNVLDEDIADELAQAVVAHKNILIAGATGSGKTTLARALIDAIPLHERLITIEDTPEWTDIPHRNRVALFYSKGGQGSARVTSEDLLESSLRMRPDRVLMQELRDGATWAYLRSIVAGHPGCITTLHADSAMGAFDALRLMIRQHTAGATLDDKDIKERLHSLVDIVVHCERRMNVFRVTSIYRKDERP